MRSLELISRAIGTDDFDTVGSPATIKSEFFEAIDIRLPVPAFSGMPQDWRFLIHNKESLRGLTPPEASAVLDEAFQIVTQQPTSQLIVLLTDDPTIHLSDEFDSFNRDVFCLDSVDLLASKYSKIQGILSPLVLAVRRKLDKRPLLVRAFSPYVRNRQASGWRFFGRRKELDDLTLRNENFFVVGARRIGKSSLMREAEKRLQRLGEDTYFVDVEDCASPADVTREILHVISPRDLAHSIRHHELLHDSTIASVFRRMATRGKRTTVFLDELGNVIAKLPREDWSFLWKLRKFSAHGNLRFVISCFQELATRQFKEFDGPMINFASVLRLDVFKSREVEEFIFGPIELWHTIDPREKDALRTLAITQVGAHPYFLQYFCDALFLRIGHTRQSKLLHEAQRLLTSELKTWCVQPIEELFFLIPSAVVKYVFLKRCSENEQTAVSQQFIDDEWVNHVLEKIGLRSTSQARKDILESLEMHGLCSAVDNERSKKVVSAPLIFRYVSTYDDVAKLLDIFSQESRADAATAGLEVF